jgi:hypothetical protein
VFPDRCADPHGTDETPSATVVTLMAIKDKQPTRPNNLALYVLNKVLQPLNSYLVSRLAVVTDCDSPVARYILLVLSRQMILTSEDEKWRDGSASSVNSLDHCYPLANAWLNSL